MLAGGLEFKDAVLETQHNLLTLKKSEKIFPSKPKKDKQ